MQEKLEKYMTLKCTLVKISMSIRDSYPNNSCLWSLSCGDGVHGHETFVVGIITSIGACRLDIMWEFSFTNNNPLASTKKKNGIQHKIYKTRIGIFLCSITQINKPAFRDYLSHLTNTWRAPNLSYLLS